MNSQTQELLVPFDEATQVFLKGVDTTIRNESTRISDEVTKANNNEESELDAHDAGLIALFSAFGVMYNRCVLAGWIDDVHPIVMAEDASPIINPHDQG